MNEPFDDNEDELSDQSLLRRFRIGEQDAATALYVRYAKKLQRLTYSQTGKAVSLHVDPDGIVQSVFRTFFRRASKGEYDVMDGEELWKLFLVIALNKIRNASKFYRADKRDVARNLPLDHTSDVHANGTINDADAMLVLKMTVDELLSEYPVTQQQIIKLRIEGFHVKEIAEKTGRAKRSVERSLQQFRKHLQAQLDS